MIRGVDQHHRHVLRVRAARSARALLSPRSWPDGAGGAELQGTRPAADRPGRVLAGRVVALIRRTVTFLVRVGRGAGVQTALLFARSPWW